MMNEEPRVPSFTTTAVFGAEWTVTPDEIIEPPVEHAPTLSNVTGPSEVKVGDKIVITGKWADEDGDDIYIMSEITFPDGKNTTMGIIYFSSDDVGGDFPIYEYVDIGDGTFTYTFDTKAYKQIYDAAAKEAPELLDLIGGFFAHKYAVHSHKFEFYCSFFEFSAY